MTLRQDIEQAINEELQTAGIALAVDMYEFHVHTDSGVVMESTDSDGKLSEALIEHHFPIITGPEEFAHYTGFDTFKNIVDSAELRLACLLKRIDEAEFKTFSDDHNLSGHLQPLEGKPEPYYKLLMNDLFYTSFTSVQPVEEDYMWNEFGENGAGVKLVFRIQPIGRRAELRPVYYSKDPKHNLTVINQICTRILKDFKRHLILRGISRIGAFYLPFGFNVENESRLLVKRWDVGPANQRVVGDGANAYLPLSINQDNPFCKIELCEIVPGSNRKQEDINAVLAACPQFLHLMK